MTPRLLAGAPRHPFVRYVLNITHAERDAYTRAAAARGMALSNLIRLALEKETGVAPCALRGPITRGGAKAKPYVLLQVRSSRRSGEDIYDELVCGHVLRRRVRSSAAPCRRMCPQCRAEPLENAAE